MTGHFTVAMTSVFLMGFATRGCLENVFSHKALSAGAGVASVALLAVSVVRMLRARRQYREAQAQFEASQVRLLRSIGRVQ